MKKTEPVFWIGSIVVSAIFAMLIIMTAGVIAEMLKTSTGVGCLQLIRWVSYFMAAGIFAVTFRHLMKKKRQTLKNYYFLSVIIAIVSALLIMQVILSPFQSLILKMIPIFEERLGGIFALALMYVIAAANVIIVILIFGFLTKKKSEYIRYISEQVGRISESEEDVYIEEKGEDELAALSRNINQMSAALLENRRKQALMENQKNELISNVSHDLRSPLTSIIGYIQLLKENGCRDEEKFNQYIEVTDRRLKALNALIDELFELTKLNSPTFEMKLEEADITGFVKQFAYEMSAILGQNGLNLICFIDDRKFIAKADCDRLARVMQNLFANVIKYAAENTDVILESRIEPGKIEINLSNYVKKNTDINTHTMFDRFYKADPSRSDFESAGLGLAIAKRIIELHGGSISAGLKGNLLRVVIVLFRRL